MSGKEETDLCCANCGVAEVDDIKLEDCDGCDLVKYCSDGCREGHREQHGEECKRRLTELHDKELFSQPDGSHHGECPICFFPMPLDGTKYGFWTCCRSYICHGCVYANRKANRCQFCRTPSASAEETSKRNMKRVKANDPAAISFMGVIRHNEGDYDSAMKLFSRAAELGNFHAHYMLGNMYMDGDGVEKNEKKAVYHYEKAAIGGHPYARHNFDHCCKFGI